MSLELRYVGKILQVLMNIFSGTFDLKEKPQNFHEMKKMCQFWFAMTLDFGLK